MESRMFPKPRDLSRASRSPQLHAEALEGRALLSGNFFALASKGAASRDVVSVQAPGAFISESATSIDVTIVRSLGSKQVAFRSPLALSVKAHSVLPARRRGGPPRESNQITPVDESVTFQAGETTKNVVLPIHAEAPMPALVPVAITVAQASHPRQQAQTVVDLVSTPDAVPPAINAVRIVRRGSVGKGIALTFSQPMAPSTVENVHNYAVKSVPKAQLDLVALSSTSILQPSPYTNNPPHSVALRAARYNAATDTVILIPKSPLTPAKSYTVRSPASLGSRRTGPRIARPLTDVHGNVLNPLNNPAGSFSITLSPTQPTYVAPQST
jgi:hypothetical protein